MHLQLCITEQSRITCAEEPKTVRVVEVYHEAFAFQPHTLTLTFTDRDQIEDLIASCTALLFDFLTEAEVDALR